ncbi:HIT family protein [Paenibacillus qinlingensis]|uniref:Diadenosine tetraphosphate (Ap4A) HIT family hydrolase n=1 Tax=Paenibacillus qinlingensis TaxID=1837343 RepID=A0ABU1NYV3_9BACL|nr:HIT family protein [Paenibacillus qinlingensis]MDR6552678.1 diadenosine tetraphosphate (Ap4A) HIT family hydrolase [Paenibacillus qinlingensis]
MEKSCLGCQLANGQVEAHVVYENEWLTVILDIAPLNEGHVLLIPKKHVAELDEMEEEVAAAMLTTSMKMSRLIKKCFQPDGVTIIQNGGIFNDLGHVHVHVFPRYAGDGFGWLEPEDHNNNQNRLAETKFFMINAINDLCD